MEDNIENTESGGQAEQSPQGQEPEQSQEQPGVKPDKDACMWAMFCHLAGLAAYVFPFAGNIILPLILWQIKKDQYPFVDSQGKEAVNFQISVTLYAIATIPLFLICVGPFLLGAICLAAMVLLIIAGVKANNGESYRYPLTIRFIK